MREVLEKISEKRLGPADLLRMAPSPPRLAPVLNRLIDRVMHPLAEKNRALYALDSLLHISVEMGDAFVDSLAKTIRYNISKILEER